jgi:hypothetical protein
MLMIMLCLVLKLIYSYYTLSLVTFLGYHYCRGGSEQMLIIIEKLQTLSQPNLTVQHRE